MQIGIARTVFALQGLFLMSSGSVMLLSPSTVSAPGAQLHGVPKDVTMVFGYVKRSVLFVGRRYHSPESCSHTDEQAIKHLAGHVLHTGGHARTKGPLPADAHLVWRGQGSGCRRPDVLRTEVVWCCHLGGRYWRS